MIKRRLLAIALSILSGVGTRPLTAQVSTVSIGGIATVSTAPMSRASLGVLAQAERSVASWVAIRAEASATVPILSAEHLVCPVVASCDTRTTSWLASAVGALVLGSTTMSGPFASIGAGGYTMGWHEGVSGRGPSGTVTTAGLGWRWTSGDRIEARFSRYNGVTTDPGRVIGLQFTHRM